MMSAKLRARRLKLNDPRIIAKYNLLLDKLYNKHRLYTKMWRLNSIPIDHPLLKEMMEMYKDIDSIRVQGMKHAEKHSRKLHAGEISRIPKITMLQLKLNYCY